jgi:hypothetical protein
MTRRPTWNSLVRLATIVVLIAGSGANCQRPLSMNPFGGQGAIPPKILLDGASRDQIVAAINQNSAKIQSLSATGVSIKIEDAFGVPMLTGNIAAERPRRFRLTAGTGVTGSEIDFGSNDELFWIWMKRNQPPAVYFCRHEQFANSAIRQMMPVEPAWLLAALGMVDIDPGSVYDGPKLQKNGRVELRAWMPTGSGRLPRVLVIDPLRALVLEQYVYDAGGTTVLASAVAESFYFDAVSQVALPERVTIRLPSSGLAFKVDLGRAIAVNRLTADPGQLFAMPSFQGTQVVDLSGAIPGTALPGMPVGGTPSPAIQGAGTPLQPTYSPTVPVPSSQGYSPVPSTSYPPALYSNGQSGTPISGGRL